MCDHAKRVQEIIAEVVQRRSAGEELPDEGVIGLYPELAESLRAELKTIADPPREKLAEGQPVPALPPVLDETVDHSTSHGSGYSALSLEWAESVGIAEESDRFRKLRPFDAGAIGEIWLALDMQLQREVALKELQERHNDDPQKKGRFLVEGRVTGILEHPGIVPVYSLGIDKQKHPYYAMRMVRGESLKQAIKKIHENNRTAKSFSRQDLGFCGLLRRFSDVCITVAYAHSRGVLHRDLKPDNVMLGKYGETYVVDWGMARVVGSRPEQYSRISEEVIRPVRTNVDSATKYGSFLGTPGFMSPEQADGRLDEMGPTADVYSLGAILYYLLTDHVPISSNSLTDFLIKVSTGDFPSPRELNPSTPKPLVEVCLKALSIGPEDRYQSARDLANEIDRWLADEPVQAASETPLEKLGRFVRHNYRWLVPVCAASLLVALTACIAAFSINQARARAEASALAEREAKQQAERNFIKARETVDTWLIGYNDALQNIPIAGLQSIRARMLELAANEYEAFVAEQVEDPTLRIEQGKTLIRLGSIYRMLGRFDEAKTKYQRGIQVLNGFEGSQPIGRQDISSTVALAHGMLALLYADQGDLGSSEKEFEKGFQELGQSIRSPTLGEEFQAPLTTLWTNWGGVLAKSGDFERADRAFQQALKLGEASLNSSPEDLNARRALATAQIGSGQIMLVQGDARAAANIFEKATKYLDAAVLLDGDSVQNLQLVIAANSYFAISSRRTGQCEHEVRAYLAAIDAAKKLAQLQPEVPSFRANLAMMKTNLGQAYLEQYEMKKAKATLVEAVEILTGLVAQSPAVPNYRESLATTLANLAQIEQTIGEFDTATRLVNRAENEIEDLINAFPDVEAYQERAAVLKSTHAQILFQQHRLDESLKEFKSAEQILSKLDSQQPNIDRQLVMAMVLLRHGQTLQETDPKAAAQLFTQSHRIWDAILAGSTDPQLRVGAAWFYSLLGYKNEQDVIKAVSLASQPAIDAPDNIKFQLTLALAQAMAGKWDDCRTTIEKQLVHPSSIASVFGFVRALALQNSGDYKQSETEFQMASQWTAANMPGDMDLFALKAICEDMLAFKRPEESQ
jgi:serine/threonine-protein kinase